MQSDIRTGDLVAQTPEPNGQTATDRSPNCMPTVLKVRTEEATVRVSRQARRSPSWRFSNERST